jgi:hypothetical protein
MAGFKKGTTLGSYNISGLQQEKEKEEEEYNNKSFDDVEGAGGDRKGDGMGMVIEPERYISIFHPH